MKSFWSLSKYATDPAVQAVPQTAVAPAPAPSPTPAPSTVVNTPTHNAPAVNPAPAASNPANVSAIIKGPEGKAMTKWIADNSNAPRPGAKTQFDTWMRNPDSAKALDDIGWMNMAKRWPPMKKLFQGLPPEDTSVMKPQTPGTGLEEGKRQSEVAMLDESVEGLLGHAMGAFGQNFKEEIRQEPWLEAGVADAFLGNTVGKKKKWKLFFEKYPELLPDDFVNSGDIVGGINDQLRDYQESGSEPSVIARFTEIMSSRDPAIREKVLDFIKHMANSALKGQIMGGRGSADVATEDGSKNIADMDKQQNEEKRRGIGNEEKIENDQSMMLQDDERVAMEKAYKTFMSSPANQPMIQNLMKMTSPLATRKPQPASPDKSIPLQPQMPSGRFEAKKLVEDGIRRSIVWMGNGEGRWREFFRANPGLVKMPPDMQGYDPKRAIESPKMKPSLMEEMNTLAAQGNPQLQAWVGDIAKSYLQEFVANNVDFPKTIYQMNHLTKTVLAEMERQRDSAKKKWEDSAALGTGKNEGRSNYTTIAQRTAALKFKITHAISQLEALNDGKAHAYEGSDGNMIVRINNDDPTKKGRIVQIIKDDKGQDVEKDLDAQGFYQLSRIISPSSWIPDYLKNLATTDPSLLKKTGNLYKASGAQGEHEAECEANYQNEIPNGSPDRLAGYRKRMGSYLFNELKNKYGAEIAAIPDEAEQKRVIASHAGLALANKLATGKNKIKGVPTRGTVAHYERLAQKLLNGQPVDLSYKPGKPESVTKTTGRVIPASKASGDAQKYSEALGIHPESWYFRPPEYDPYNGDDRDNINSTLMVAIDSVLPILLHKKRQAMHRGKLDQWVSPKALYYWIAILNPYSQVAKGGVENKSDEENEAVRRKTKLLYQLIPPESPVSKEHNAADILRNISKIQYEPDNYEGDRFPGHLPQTGKRYEVGPDGIRRYYYDKADKDIKSTPSIGGLENKIKRLEHHLRKTPNPINPEVMTEIFDELDGAKEWLSLRKKLPSGQSYDVPETPEEKAHYRTLSKDIAKNVGILEHHIKSLLTPAQSAMFDKELGKVQNWKPRMSPGPGGDLIHKFDNTRMGRFLRAWFELDRIETSRNSRVKYASADYFNQIIDVITDSALHDLGYNVE